MIVSYTAGKVEVSSGRFVFAESLTNEEANRENEVSYIPWDELKPELRVKLKELSKDVSEKAEELKQLIMEISL